MASYLGPILIATAAILLLEIVCGRHRGVRWESIPIGIAAIVR